MTTQQFRSYGRLFILSILIFLAFSHLFAVEQTQAGASGTGKFRLFALKHISAEQSRKYLSEAKLGTVSPMPGSNTILVTAGPGELNKAMAVLNLVDAEDEFVVTTIFTASGAGSLPSSEQLSAQIGNISVGTFSNPPAAGSGARAIIDVHNDAVIVVSPVSQMERIILAVEQAQTVIPTETKVVEEPITVQDPNVVKQPKIEQPGRAKEPQKTVVPRQAKIVPKVSNQSFITSAYSPEPADNADEILKMQLPEKLQIVDLLGLVGEYLHLNFMYDPLKIKGDITLRIEGTTKGNMRVGDLYPILEAALKFRGFAMTRKGNLVVVVPVVEAPDIDPVLYEPGKGKIESGDVIISRIFTLEHIDAASATNFLTAMKLGINPPQAAGPGKLIVTEYAYRMERVEQLLKMIDLSGEPRKFRFRQLKFTMAQTLAPRLKILAEQLGTVSITVSASSSTRSSSPSGRRPGESTTAYTQRLAKERAAAASRARGYSQLASTQQEGVYLDADERTNRIMMIGIEEQLAVIESLIDSLDVEQQDLRTLQVYKIEHVGAGDVLKKLQELNIIGGTSKGYSSSGTRITGAKPTTGSTGSRTLPASSRTGGTSGASLGALVEEPQVVIIEPTNSLLVNATAEQHARIETIIGYVDSETEEGVMPYVIYPLENQSPEDLEQVLSKLIQETIKDKEGKIERVVKKTEDDIVIVPDEKTFSLIVYASKKNQEWIASLIKTLDKRRPQVLIEVSLVEITRNDEFQYDLNLIANAKKSILGNIQIAGDFLPNLSAIGNEVEAGWNQTIKSGETISHTGFRGFLAEDKIQVLLEVMEQKKYGRILARPKILVNDNEEGIIRTTEKTHVAEEIMTYPGTTQGQTPIPVKSITWVPYEAKIELSIKPNISEGNLLRLEINMIREDFERLPVGPPDYRTSDITTVVTVPDGSTIILGGLTKLNQTKGGSKIPFLGDIPIIGGLFRTISNNDKASKLYVFVKANILRPEETSGLTQLQRISEENRAIFEEAEKKFQVYEDWPGIKATPMDPLRVLSGE